MAPFQISKNQRLLIAGIFVVSYFTVTLGLDLLHEDIYSLIATLLYYLGGYAILSALFGGPSAEEGYTFPFPIDTVFNNVPRVFESNRKRPYGRRKLYGKVANVDVAAKSYLLKLGWWPLASYLMVNLTKLDANRTIVQVRYKTESFHLFNPSKAMLRLFFDLLYSSITV